jgi:hypothetical protein
MNWKQQAWFLRSSQGGTSLPIPFIWHSSTRRLKVNLIIEIIAYSRLPPQRMSNFRHEMTEMAEAKTLEDPLSSGRW